VIRETSRQSIAKDHIPGIHPFRITNHSTKSFVSSGSKMPTISPRELRTTSRKVVRQLWSIHILNSSTERLAKYCDHTLPQNHLERTKVQD